MNADLLPKQVGRGLTAVGDGVPDVKDGQHQTIDEQPFPPQARGPEEADAAEEPEEHRRIAERSEQPAGIADNEDEKGRNVPGPFSDS